ncbi:MAG: ADP-forming succinate--CoA ligase subunit beta [Ignavibacteriaceae bacterium]|jgi:succinyl-CoA synthetase (ADP-forming) beta subunit (EC 6.2.1.5)|nr:MAG: ADP-forming succinate--CoA ligase subunit beta [Chlorobiota bacterium]KXK02323.1 MAG: succinyl-CoA synthetase, beta subunit [Chlorobi bacterium OLB4]MBV6398821.1 Succinate--CoA ligase [ADP-forming] subunit beta [Ignavibacteria bacterium]MCC6885007.1 ADP-forming succinate--CoA ligase subunit beta [Ignavibacteriales bacterium]MCE7952202.1 ADP-forming succinate--CoA ligase subunit beta [Chlorobi bacterium CHB7]MDL1886241.1 ADP-forming succinate--CoA ligase subunit beta [Ignavibacteria bac
MKLHEYQAKSLLKKFGVTVQDGHALNDLRYFDDAVNDLMKRGISEFVVKSQIHAGGRGKGVIYNQHNPNEIVVEGGVKYFGSDVKGAKEYASKLLGNILVTHQTGPEGKQVRTIYVTEGLNYKKELYLGILLDREKSKNVIMASTEGGVEIEKVAEETPDKIIKVWIDPEVGLSGYKSRELGYGLGLEGNAFKDFIKFINNLYRAYEELDASLIEVNPLVISSDDKIIALDAKVTIDDNSLFRHKDIAEMRDTNEEDPLEVEASKSNLNYIKLDGNVGCMVNGAGLAMASMDLIKLAGGEPANFLDVGGTASAETVENGFRIILSDPNVKAILINIFGGIVRCDRVAQGVIQAAKNINIQVPVVVRLQGTNSVEARKMLDESGLKLIPADTLQDAAQKVTEAIAA